MAALVVVLALLTSGCFAIRGMSLSRNALAPGEATMVRLELRPYASGIQTSDKVFVLIGWSDADRRSKVKFDTLGNWGGPYDGKSTLSLATHLLAGGACQAYGLDAAIIDVLDTEIMDAAISADVLMNRIIYSDSYLKSARM